MSTFKYDFNRIQHFPHLKNKKTFRIRKKHVLILYKIFYFPNATIWIRVICNDCIICQLNKPYPNQKQNAEKKNLKDKVFNLITEYHLTQKDQFHHPQKETHM